jgi:hypothetical protein
MLVAIPRTDANGDNEGGGQACSIQIQSQMFEVMHVIIMYAYLKLLGFPD